MWPEKSLCFHFGPCKGQNTTTKTSNASFSQSKYYRIPSQDWHQKQACLSRNCLNTFGLKASTVQRWVQVEHGMHKSPAHTKHPQKAKQENVKRRQSVTEFLSSLAKMPSHYCRASTGKEYLENIIPTKTELCEIYKDWCLKNHKPQGSRGLLMDVFAEMNLAFLQPRKVQCDVCCSYETNNISEQEYRAHLIKMDQARVEKQKDKENKVQQTVVITMDVQAVLLAPKILASAVYYKTKLCSHNFTVYNVHTKDVVCYLWHEGEGGLTANMFATCIYDYLQNEIGDNVQTIIMYSDGCGYQNRNITLSNTLTYFAQKLVKLSFRSTSTRDIHKWKYTRFTAPLNVS